MRFLRIPSLRWRLVAVMCLAYILVAATTEIAGYGAQRGNLRNQLAARARTEAAILAAGSVANLTSGNTGTLQTFVGSLTRGNDVNSASIVGEGSEVIASTNTTLIGKRHPLPFVTRPQVRTLKNGNLQGLSPIVQTTQLGIAEVVVSGVSIERDLRNLVILETSVRALGLLIFFLLSLVIAQYILGPLAMLSRASGAIRRGYLSTRVSLRDGTEMETVAAGFNDMALALQERIEHLTFLSTAGALLPHAFREGGDVARILQDFCAQVKASAGGLLPGQDTDSEAIWYEAEGDAAHRAAIRALARRGDEPVVGLGDGHIIMTIPVLGGMVFAAVREGSRPFNGEEQQVITNFANQLAIAADNARLFEAQQEALRVKDQFLSIVSHELRTPLTTIKGYAQMLRRRLADDADAERFADNIDAQTSRLSRLVDDLLDVTRFTRGQFELMPQRMDLRPLLEEVATRFRLVAPTHDIELQMEDGSYEGNWDWDRLEQVLNNLVGNAVKYSPSGGTIRITSEHQDGRLLIGVEDQGIGVPEEDQKQLFERFFRGRAEGQEIKGLGLGLFVTRRIVEAHGGQIGVTSTPEVGSRFFFTLPLARAADAVKDHAQTAG